MNNAGIYGHGDVELCSIEMYKKVADVNLYGTIRVTKAFLPLVRKSQGKYISQVLGRTGQSKQILIRVLLRSRLIGVYTVCHSWCIFWMLYCIVKFFRIIMIFKIVRNTSANFSNCSQECSKIRAAVIKLFLCSTQLSMIF